MKTSLMLLVTTLMLVASTGCVSQRKADDLETAYRRSQEQVVDLQARIAELQQRIRLLESDRTANADQLAQLAQERDQLMAQLNRLSDEYGSLAERTQTVALTPEVDEALREFAAQNPALVTYDPALGMLKLRSDLTFALGSADLSASARNSLQQLAQILNTPAAQQYEIRVVGHTDNVPVNRPATRAKHPNNWYLSVHRAIAVRDALDNAGISPARFSVSGYSQYWPVVPNGPRGAEANRRVEIYLLNRPRPTLDAARVSPAEAPTEAPEPQQPRPLK